jgi:uncharacterized protein YoxC
MSKPLRLLLSLALLLLVASELVLARRVVTLADEVEDLQARVSALDKDLADANDTLDRAETAVDQLHESVDALGAEMDDLGQRSWREAIPQLQLATLAVEQDLQLALAAFNPAGQAPNDGQDAPLVTRLEGSRSCRAGLISPSARHYQLARSPRRPGPAWAG